MFAIFEKERNIRKQLLDNSKNVAKYVDEDVDAERLAVLTMIKLQQELASKRHNRRVRAMSFGLHGATEIDYTIDDEEIKICRECLKELD